MALIKAKTPFSSAMSVASRRAMLARGSDCDGSHEKKKESGC